MLNDLKDVPALIYLCVVTGLRTGNDILERVVCSAIDACHNSEENP